MDKFEPKLIGFLCNWCTSAAADLAGVSRLQYPPNIVNIRVMCSGSVDPMYVLAALFEGADGVLVGGCHPGDCHYLSGNYYAERRMKLLFRFLEALGIEKQRLRLEWISASEGAKFSQVVTDFTEEIRTLGPLSLKGPKKVEEIEYSRLARVIAVLGSAGKLFWDEPKCMVDLIQHFLNYVQKESCGECVPCRIGTKRMQELIQKIVSETITEEEKIILKEIAEVIGPSSKCDLGKIAGKSLMYVLKYCKDDISAHLGGRCAQSIGSNSGWEAIVAH